jgi:site-specific recombinase
LRSLALLHAAIAGVWLFVSGLISGYFDNKAAYDRIGLRVAGLTWLRRLVGEQRAKTLGSYIDRNLGGLAGNFFFGFMLGMTGTFGHLLGLPLDIRHITFSTANLAYGAVGLEFAMSAGLWLHCILGIALIGIINLTVSFARALWTALRAHGVRITHAGALLRYVSRQFVVSPMQFFYPPNKTADTAR